MAEREERRACFCLCLVLMRERLHFFQDQHGLSKLGMSLILRRTSLTGGGDGLLELLSTLVLCRRRILCASVLLRRLLIPSGDWLSFVVVISDVQSRFADLPECAPWTVHMWVCENSKVGSEILGGGGRYYLRVCSAKKVEMIRP